jgi:hypothetical protein
MSYFRPPLDVPFQPPPESFEAGPRECGERVSQAFPTRFQPPPEGGVFQPPYTPGVGRNPDPLPLGRLGSVARPSHSTGKLGSLLLARGRGGDHER